MGFLGKLSLRSKLILMVICIVIGTMLITTFSANKILVQGMVKELDGKLTTASLDILLLLDQQRSQATCEVEVLAANHQLAVLLQKGDLKTIKKGNRRSS